MSMAANQNRKKWLIKGKKITNLFTTHRRSKILGKSVKACYSNPENSRFYVDSKLCVVCFLDIVNSGSRRVR